MHFKNIFKLFSVFSLALMIFSSLNLLSPITASAQSAAPTEPTCQSVATTPSFNPYPLVTNLPNPDITSNNCKDMPMLSFYPIDANNNNPRSLSITQNQNFSIHIYYDNGATPSTACIQAPTVKIQVTKVSDTQYKISGTLSGSNATTVTSAQKGGDLILNVPAGTKLNIVGNNTLHYPDAIERRYQTDTTGATPYDRIVDNSSGAIVSNPIYTAFPDTTVTSTNGFQVKNCLEAGFLGYGYILSQITANVTPTQTNTPPQLPGQEITIIRGENGSFQPYNGTDPENDVPITYTDNNIPSFCTRNTTTNVVTCQTNAQTPVRSTYTVTPTDSKGLSGNPATFIVNIIEPGLNITKTCVKKDTTTDCASANLKAGDQVSYKINVRNTGSAPAKNTVVTDTYDKNRLSNVININPTGTLDANAGTVIWNLGTVNNGDSKDLTFDATIQATVKNGDVIINIAKVVADGIPEKQAQVQFPVGGVPPTLQSEKLCVKKGTTTPCASANLTLGDTVGYIINVKNNGTQPATNVQVVDTYDKSRLTNIGNLNPNGTLDANAGTITWNVGTVNPGETKTLTFDAVIASSVSNGDIIVNVAKITADNLPPQTVQVQFPVVVAPKLTPRSGGSTAFLISGLGILTFAAGVYYYRKYNKIGKSFTPKRNEEVKIK